MKKSLNGIRRTRSSRARAQFGPLDVDIEGIVRSQDLVYENAAVCWQDGHILGNGDLGAVAYAPHWLEWTVNKVDVYDGRNAPLKKHTYAEVIAEAERRKTRFSLFLNEIEKAAPDYRGPPQPQLKSCGQLKIRTMANEYSWAGPPPYRCRQVLSLWEAEDRMALSLGGGSVHMKVKTFAPVVTSFVSRRRNLLAIRMERVLGPLWAKRIELVRPPDADYPAPEFGRSKDGATVWFRQRGPDGTSYAMALGVTVTGGVFEFHDPLQKQDCRDPAGLVGVEQQGDRIWITVKGDVDLFVSAASSRETADPLGLARRTVTQALADGYAAVRREHRAWWQTFWRQSFIQLEQDALREQLWYFGLYQMGSSLGRAPVPGLNGLWYGFSDSPGQKVFHAVYTMDVNIQLASMPVWMVNHPELGHPFMDTFLKALPDVRRWTKAQFDLPGACFTLEMPFDSALGEPSFGPAYRLSFTGGPFCGLLFCWAYRYTRDRTLLREKVYPFLREVVRFFSAFLRPTATGRYEVPLTVPCEVLTLSRNAVDIVSLLKPCMEMVVAASKMLRVDAGERARWEDILAKYPEYPQVEGRIVNGLDVDPALGSWWWSQLWALGLAHDERPEVRTLTRATLDYWYPKGTGAVKNRSGWPSFFETLAELHLGARAAANYSLGLFIRNMLKPNGLMPHMSLAVENAGPRYRELAAATPENNTAVVMLQTLMLLQSHNDLIRVFPAVNGKRTLRFGHLRAEGAFLVSAEMVKGNVTFVSITAEKGGVARVENPWPRGLIRCVRGKSVVQTQGRILAFDLRPGESVVLSPAPYRRKRIATCHLATAKVQKFNDGTIVRLGKAG